MPHYPHHIAARIFGPALAIEPYALRARLDTFSNRLKAEAEEGGKDPAERRKDLVAAARADAAARMTAYTDAAPVEVDDGLGMYGLTTGGIAIVSIVGPLIAKADAFLEAICGLTSYERICAVLDAAVADSRVKGILLDVDSPGGECLGMLDAADHIAVANALKPVWAIANGMAYSAAYALASSAGRILLPRMAGVGSVGAVVVHVDESKADQMRGLSYTAVFSGARKVDGWGHAPMSEAALKKAQGRIDDARRQFAETVARNRTAAGVALGADAVMATEADIFMDAAAIEAGLADEVATFDQALAGLTSRVRSPAPSGGAKPSTHRSTSARGASMADASEKPGTDPAQSETTGDTFKPCADCKNPDVCSGAGACYQGTGGGTPPADEPKPADAAAIETKMRAEFAAVTAACEQAAKLGVKIAASDAIAKGMSADAVRAHALHAAAEAADKSPIDTTASHPDAKAGAGGWSKAINSINERAAR